MQHILGYTEKIIAIIILLAQISLDNHWIEFIGFAALYVAAGLTLWSMAVYLRAAWPDFKDSM